MKIVEKSTMIACILAGLAGLAFAQSAADEALSGQVDEVVRAQMREQKIPGVSLAVMRDGKIIKATGYGLANLELSAPVTPESVFHSESVGKTFTAVAVLILVEEGKVGLDDKITKYFPESPAWKDVTVRQLLTHTSGIPDYLGEFGDKSFVDLQRNYTEDEVVRIIAGQPLDFQPGEKRAYSNSGYVILGALIRRVTGKNWADFVQERIFGPLGMTSTRVISEADIIPNRTSGYHLVHGQWKNTDWVAPSLNTLADGTLYTNVLDMAKWDEALSTEKILKRTTIDQMWVPIKLNSGEIFPQGLCFRIDNVNGHRLAWKDGEFQGYTTIMSRYLDDHLTVVVLTNLGEDANIPLHIAEGVAGIYIPGLGGATAKTAPSSTVADTAEITAGPEMDRLKFYIGDWAYTEEYPKSELFPNGGHNTGHWSAQRGPGGLSVINTFSSHGGGDNYQGMEVMMWDPKAKGYRDNALWYDSPDRWIFTGNFEGETLAYHGEFEYLGKQVKFRSETRPIAGGGFTLTEFASVNGRPEQLLLVGRAVPTAGLRSPAHAQSAMNTAPADGKVNASAQQLSPAQKEVWAAEESMHRYEQQRDAKRFLSLWDENFVGWPDYEQRPVRKPEIEKIVVEDFQTPKSSGSPLPAPKPEAIGISGNIAVTHYFWPEADQTSPTVFRTMHTWQKGPQGWRIIGGMSCEVPRAETKAIAPASGQASAAFMAANPRDVNTLDGIVAASYQALSGPIGTPRQWDRYRSLVDPQARLVSASVDAATGEPRIVRWNREEYAAATDEYLVKTGFVDRKLGCVTGQYGNVAAVRCGFEGLEQSKLVERGVAIYQLYNDGKRWWITSVVWDQERPGNPLPAELLSNW